MHRRVYLPHLYMDNSIILLLYYTKHVKYVLRITSVSTIPISKKHAGHIDEIIETY